MGQKIAHNYPGLILLLLDVSLPLSIRVDRSIGRSVRLTFIKNEESHGIRQIIPREGHKKVRACLWTHARNSIRTTINTSRDTHSIQLFANMTFIILSASCPDIEF